MVYWYDVESKHSPHVGHVDREADEIADGNDEEKELGAESLDFQSKHRQKTQNISDGA